MSGKGEGARKKLVAIEIGRDWLKMVEIERPGRNAAVSRLHLERIDENDPSLTEAISTAFGQGHFSTDFVMLCIPRQMVTVRLLKLPSLDPEEVADMVELQVGKQTPYSREEIMWDYRIVGAEREGYTRVMLVIAQRGVVRHRVNLLEAAGVSVDAVSISTEGLLNWMDAASVDPRNGRGVLVADMDSFYTDVNVSVNGASVFSRSVRIGANQVAEAPEEWLTRLAGELQRCIDISRGETPGLEIERIVFSGARAVVRAAADDMSKRTGIACETADATVQVRRMPKTPTLGDPMYGSVSIGGLIGMGLAPENVAFNLMPESVAMRRRLVERSRVLTTFGCLLMTLMVSLSLWGSTALFARARKLETLEAYRAEVAPRIREVQRRMDLLELARKDQDQTYAALNVLAMVQRVRPANVYLETVEIDRDGRRVVLSGTGGTLGDIRTLENAMQASGMFRQVRPGSTTRTPDNRYSFQVDCVLGGES